MKPNFGDRIVEKKKRERTNRIKRIFLYIFMLIAVTGMVTMAYFFGKKHAEVKQTVSDSIDTEQEKAIYKEEKETYTQEDVEHLLAEAKWDGSKEVLTEMKQLLEEGSSVVEAFRKLYTDDLVVASSGKYHFVPIRDDLKKHQYQNENLSILGNGEYRYVEEGQVTSYKGIDVSRFQGEIDWEQVAADGVQFAFIRVGNRGYGSGKLVYDEQFEANIEGANKAGIKVGVYFFTQAITEEEVLEEANFVLEKIAPYRIECPIVFDVEKVAGKDARLNGLTPEERTHLIKVFCDAIATAGYQPMIYCNLEVSALMMNLEELEEYDKWIAYYKPDFYFPYDFKVWQYSDKGTVAGIKEKVDLDISFVKLWE